jgi:hypothetical protein
MKHLATTYRLDGQLCTLHFSNRDLRALSLSHPFVTSIGMYENHTVASGQDTEAWVRRSTDIVRRAAGDLLDDDSLQGTNWPEYAEQLISFLADRKDQHLAIRHHYAWWFPKWVDQWLA